MVGKFNVFVGNGKFHIALSTVIEKSVNNLTGRNLLAFPHKLVM